METVANTAHLPPLDDPHEREAVGAELQVALRELIDLSLIGKQLHWSVVGPAARSVHLFLDELVGEWRELADVVAERAVTLGFVPDGQAAAVSEGSRVGRRVTEDSSRVAPGRYVAMTSRCCRRVRCQGRVWIRGSSLSVAHSRNRSRGRGRSSAPLLLEEREICAGLELRSVDEAGSWEMFGYHNYGDPWREHRYSGD
ncbi:ferritin-like domain-containing protein [Kribbella sp. NBC_00889]|nr:ferritin-like domain-containing protein [Kribbella sp. NBC_00889]